MSTRRPLALKLSLVTLALVATAVGAAACSGKTSDTTGDGGATTSGVDGGPGARPTDCPATLPDSDTPCSKDGLLCEYGDDHNPLCNTIRVCSSSGKWSSPVYYGGGQQCPSVPPAPPANAASCPATREEVPEGQACSTNDHPGTCSYATGSICRCGVYCPSYPVQQQDCDPDAGITTSCCDRSKVQWICFDGPPACPNPRPSVGSACSREGDSCAIDAPAECGQTVLECKDGVWNVANTACPISTKRAKHEIHYVAPEERAELKDELLKVRLAEYRYNKGEDTKHLGFIIEDMPEGSPAVLASRDRVDLYGYVSMAVATMQEQQKEIDAMKVELARLRAENAGMKRGAKHAK